MGLVSDAGGLFAADVGVQGANSILGKGLKGKGVKQWKKQMGIGRASPREHYRRESMTSRGYRRGGTVSLGVENINGMRVHFYKVTIKNKHTAHVPMSYVAAYEGSHKHGRFLAETGTKGTKKQLEKYLGKRVR
jgi:hypothetical protein